MFIKNRHDYECVSKPKNLKPSHYLTHFKRLLSTRFSPLLKVSPHTCRSIPMPLDDSFIYHHEKCRLIMGSYHQIYYITNHNGLQGGSQQNNTRRKGQWLSTSVHDNRLSLYTMNKNKNKMHCIVHSLIVILFLHNIQ